MKGQRLGIVCKAESSGSPLGPLKKSGNVTTSSKREDGSKETKKDCNNDTKSQVPVRSVCDG